MGTDFPASHNGSGGLLFDFAQRVEEGLKELVKR
jgi:hypothetical protein